MLILEVGDLLFSIIVPLYNTEKYIDDCILSVLQQDENDFELIIVNDGSTDNSALIAEKYTKKDKRIKLIHQKNHGLLHTRCVGIEEAVGEYVVFLDADDTLKDGALSKLSMELLDGSIDIMIYKWQTFFDSGEKGKISRTLFQHNTIFELNSKSKLYERVLEGQDINSMCLKVTRRSCFDTREVRVLPRITMEEDLVHTLRPLTNAKKIKYIDEALYNYRIHNASMSKEFNPDVYSNSKIIHQLILKYLIEWDMDSEYWRGLVSLRFLKSTASFSLLSKSNALGKEKEYIKVIEEIKMDRFFNDAMYHVKKLPILYRLAMFLIMSCNHKLLYRLKLFIAFCRGSY